MERASGTRVGALAVLALVLCACAETEERAAAAVGPTWHGGVSAVLQAQCASCHGGAKPSGGIAFDDYEFARQFVAPGLAAIDAGRMPPWMPDPTCRPLQESRSISPDEVALLRAWVKGGTPLGTKATGSADAQSGDGGASGAPPPIKIFSAKAADLDLKPKEPYTANAKVSDDYRCFAIGPTFDKETWVRAARVTPGHSATVHHVLIYLIGPTGAKQVDARDAAEPGLGWPCYAGPGVNPSSNLASWVPGAVPFDLGESVGLRIPPGGRLVAQVHYNTVGHAVGPDLTRTELWLHGQAPKQLLRIFPLANFGIDIAAGDANSVHTKVFPNNSKSPWQIVAAMGHMHQLGKRIALQVQPQATSDAGSRCLLDIPHWDFDWQQTYRLAAPEIVQPGEQILMTCSYDNSAGNQMTVGGAKQSPKAVTWGEGTADEMCLAYVSMLEDYVALPAAASVASCSGAQACYDDCRVGGSGAVQCTLTCGNGHAGCTTCMLQGILSCSAQNGCPKQSQALIDCFSQCQGKGQACVVSQCFPLLAAFESCTGPLVAKNGVCHDEGLGCGLAL